MKQHLINRSNILSALTVITKLRTMSKRKSKLALKSRKRSILLCRKAIIFPNQLLLPLTLEWNRIVSKTKPKRWYMRRATSQAKCQGLSLWKLIRKVKFHIAKKVLKMIKIWHNHTQQTSCWGPLDSLDLLQFLQDPQAPLIKQKLSNLILNRYKLHQRKPQNLQLKNRDHPSFSMLELIKKNCKISLRLQNLILKNWESNRKVVLQRAKLILKCNNLRFYLRKLQKFKICRQQAK